MSAEKLIASALWLANEDLNAARALSGNHYAIYHVEQAAEKLIRAILISEGVQPKSYGRSHQLDDLVALVPDANPLKDRLRSFAPLTIYATTFRYPTPAGKIVSPPGSVEFDGYVTGIEQAISRACTEFEVDLTMKGAPAGNARPIR